MPILLNNPDYKGKYWGYHPTSLFKINPELGTRSSLIKMIKTLNLVYGTFKYAALSQLKQEDTLIISTAAGLMQGLKYTGSLKRGITTSITVAGVLSVVNGVNNVLLNMDNRPAAAGGQPVGGLLPVGARDLRQQAGGQQLRL